MRFRFLLILTLMSFISFFIGLVEGGVHTHNSAHYHRPTDTASHSHEYTHDHEVPPGSETHHHSFHEPFPGSTPPLLSQPPTAPGNNQNVNNQNVNNQNINLGLGMPENPLTEQPEIRILGLATNPSNPSTQIGRTHPQPTDNLVINLSNPSNPDSGPIGLEGPFSSARSLDPHQLSSNCGGIDGYSLKFDGKTLEVVAPEVPAYAVVKLGFGEVDLQGAPQEPICGLSFLLNSRLRFSLDHNTPYSLKDLEAHIRDSRNWASRPDCVESLQTGKLEALALYVMPSGTLCLVDSWKLPEPEKGGFAPRMPQRRGKLSTLWGDIKRVK